MKFADALVNKNASRSFTRCHQWTEMGTEVTTTVTTESYGGIPVTSTSVSERSVPLGHRNEFITTEVRGTEFYLKNQDPQFFENFGRGRIWPGAKIYMAPLVEFQRLNNEERVKFFSRVDHRNFCYAVIQKNGSSFACMGQRFRVTSGNDQDSTLGPVRHFDTIDESALRHAVFFNTRLDSLLGSRGYPSRAQVIDFDKVEVPERLVDRMTEEFAEYELLKEKRKTFNFTLPLMCFMFVVMMPTSIYYVPHGLLDRVPGYNMRFFVGYLFLATLLTLGLSFLSALLPASLQTGAFKLLKEPTVSKKKIKAHIVEKFETKLRLYFHNFSVRDKDAGYGLFDLLAFTSEDWFEQFQVDWTVEKVADYLRRKTVLTAADIKAVTDLYEAELLAHASIEIE